MDRRKETLNTFYVKSFNDRNDSVISKEKIGTNKSELLMFCLQKNSSFLVTVFNEDNKGLF